MKGGGSEQEETQVEPKQEEVKEHKEHTKSSTEIAGTAVCCRRNKKHTEQPKGWERENKSRSKK